MEIIAAGNEKRMEKLLHILSKGVIAWAVAAGFALCVCDLLGIACTREVLLLAAGIGVLLHSFVYHWKYGMEAGIVGLLAALVLLTVVYGEMLLNGMLSLYNEAAETLGRSGVLILTEYQLLSRQTAVRDAELFLGAVSAVLGCMCHATVCGRRKITVAVSLILAAAFLCVNREGLSDWMLFGAGSGALAVYLSYHSRKQSDVKNSSAASIFACAAAGVCIGAAVWLCSIWLPVEKYEEPETVKSLREYTLSAIDRVRYKKDVVNTLPKGDLSKAETWEATENTALCVTMSEPASLYLRGYVGSIYDSNCWQELSAEAYYEGRDLFYWLEQWGFSGNTQLSLVRSHLTDETLSDGETTIQIENVNADSEYAYVPYELITLDEGASELNAGYAENAVWSDALFGSRTYSYTSGLNLVKDFPQAAAQSYLYRRENPEAEYTEAESYYNVFVYENYTQLPVSVQTLLKSELGYAGAQGEGHADYRSVITKIRKYLEETITYGNYAEALPKDKDFLSFFLTESKIGSSVHYATAAALMFRYYGIPARYAEGYLITPEDIDGVKPGETIELTGSSGHAWTEIYVDGLGWVPIEMTPEYYDVMEQPDLTKGLQADSSIVIKPPQNQAQEPENNSSEDLKERLSQIFLNLGKIILWILICIDVFSILVFLFLLLRRITANAKRRRQFRNRDSRTAVCSMTGYMTRLVQEAGDNLPEDALQKYQSAYVIGQKAAFSQHELSGEERRNVEESRKYLLKALKKKKGWYDKWILKYVERLY